MVLVISTLYIKAAEGNQSALAYTSSALSLAVFVAVLAFHCFHQIRKTRLWKALTTRSASHLVEGKPSNKANEDIDGHKVSSRLVTRSEIVLPQPNQSNSEINSTSDNASHSNVIDKQVIVLETLHRSKEAFVPPTPIGSVQVNSSQESLDVVYSDVELREPLLSDDFAQ